MVNIQIDIYIYIFIFYGQCANCACIKIPLTATFRYENIVVRSNHRKL